MEAWVSAGFRGEPRTAPTAPVLPFADIPRAPSVRPALNWARVQQQQGSRVPALEGLPPSGKGSRHHAINNLDGSRVIGEIQGKGQQAGGGAGSCETRPGRGPGQMGSVEGRAQTCPRPAGGSRVCSARPLGPQVGTQFKDSLSSLLAILISKEPSYIRCIKPNDTKEPSESRTPPGKGLGANQGGRGLAAQSPHPCLKGLWHCPLLTCCHVGLWARGGQIA